MLVSRTPHAEVPAPAEWFTGTARIAELTAAKAPARTQIDSVHFAPAARTHWHRHPLGQTLIVTHGTGLVQRRGGPVETITVGDTVHIAPDEWHWHGAAPTSAMTHLAVEPHPADGRTTELGEAVTDAEYTPALASGSASTDGSTDTEPAAAPPPFTRDIVMDQHLPQPLATARVEIRRITIAPNFPAGLHVHNGPVFGSIETGSAIYQIEGEPETVLNPGDVFYEPENVRIARFDAQEFGVTFLGYFPLEAGVEAQLVFVED
ncbi:cupin domain-containing protein [Catenulispora yoronensis]|uniref:Cupin domain-containing protein n=1 Tax=Catenulispora yoronensis TaxID=450799 RepID=A0ABN2UEM8_9ACTN